MIRFPSPWHCTDCGVAEADAVAVITCIRKYQDDAWDPGFLDKAASSVGRMLPRFLRGIRGMPLVGLLWWPRPLSIDAYDVAFEKAYRSLSVLPFTGYLVSIIGLIFDLQVTWTCEKVCPTAQRYQVSDLVWQV
jgi:hypothetical protein